MPHFKNGFPSYERRTATCQGPTTITSGTTGYARRPPANPVRDDWPADMLLG